jgi:hypothetical protein
MTIHWNKLIVGSAKIAVKDRFIVVLKLNERRFYSWHEAVITGSHARWDIYNKNGVMGYGFFLKKYSDSQCCWKKYSDFGGGKKNNLIQSFCHIT